MRTYSKITLDQEKSTADGAAQTSSSTDPAASTSASEISHEDQPPIESANNEQVTAQDISQAGIENWDNRDFFDFLRDSEDENARKLHDLVIKILAEIEIVKQRQESQAATFETYYHSLVSYIQNLQNLADNLKNENNYYRNELNRVVDDYNKLYHDYNQERAYMNDARRQATNLQSRLDQIKHIIQDLIYNFGHEYSNKLMSILETYPES